MRTVRGVAMRGAEQERWAEGRRISLVVREIWYPNRQAFTFRVFLNQPDATAETPTKGNPHFVGKATMLGKSYYPENEKRGLLPWARPSFPPGEDPDGPITVDFDVTEHVRTFSTAAHLDVTFVLVDGRNRPLPDELLRFSGVELRPED